MKELDIDMFLKFMISEIISNRQVTYTLSAISSKSVHDPSEVEKFLKVFFQTTF